MNIIIKNSLAEYCDNQKIDQNIDISKKFEFYSSHLILSSLAETSSSTIHTVVGGDSQHAVDSIGVIVNGNLISNEDEVDNFIELNKYLDVDFVFIQSKISENFDVNALGSLGDFSIDFIKHSNDTTDTPETAEVREIKNHIYNNSNLFKNRNPNLYIFYATTGQVPKGSAVFDKKIENIKSRAIDTGMIDTCSVSPVGSAELQNLQRVLNNSIEKQFDFSRKIPLPNIKGVQEAYLGTIPAKSYLELLRGPHGNFLSSIFYDNVRDWQGENAVNAGISDTTKDRLGRERFVFMNNGVTLITKELRTTGDKILIKDYQIVNGCQTSNVLWRNRDQLDDTIHIPLKIVATTDDEVIRDIIRATNSQTAIPSSQLLAATDFQKQLEQHFLAQAPLPLYYERRSRQYVTSTIDRTRTVTPLNLMKSYVSAILKEPHRTNRNFRTVIDSAGTTIFGEKHKLEPYYLAALAQYWIDTLLRRGHFAKHLTSARFQILLAFILLNQTEEPPTPTSNKSTQWANKILSKIKDEPAALANIKPAVDLIQKLIKNKKNVRDEVRNNAFTESVIKSAKSQTPP